MTCDFEEVSALGYGICGVLGVLCEVEDDLKWGEQLWRSVEDHGGRAGNSNECVSAWLR